MNGLKLIKHKVTIANDIAYEIYRDVTNSSWVVFFTDDGISYRKRFDTLENLNSYILGRSKQCCKFCRFCHKLKELKDGIWVIKSCCTAFSEIEGGYESFVIVVSGDDVCEMFEEVKADD